MGRSPRSTVPCLAGRSKPMSSSRARVVWLALSAGLVFLALYSMGLGRMSVSWDEVCRIIGNALVPNLWDSPAPSRVRVVLLVRLPRILLAMLVGAGMSLSGAALQGVFRNPLASPDVIGVTSGAALGGVAGIMLAGNPAVTVLAAFCGGIASLLFVFLLSREENRSSVLMLILAGMVCSAFFSAMISLAKFVADPQDTLPGITFWLMGSLSSATWGRLGTVVLPVAGASCVLYALRFRIDVLSLGDEEAEMLGIRVECTRWAALAAIALISASIVSVCGVVGWVGLVVPHGARMLTGPDHRSLLITSPLLGAAFMLLVDDVARAATAVEIPLGILTAAVGAPVFVILLRRFKKQRTIQ